MKKVVLYGGMVAVALLPAVVGLAANPSLSARVHLPSSAVVSTLPPATVTASSISTPSRTRQATSSPRTSPDGHGGDRPAGASDDPAGDDKGGDRPAGASDDPAGDDNGGDRKGKSSDDQNRD